MRKKEIFLVLVRLPLALALTANGEGMWWRCLPVLLLPLTAMGRESNEQSGEDKNVQCVLQQHAALDASVTEEDGILIPTKIGDQQVYFSLGLGSGLSNVDRAAAERLGMKIRKLETGQRIYTGSNKGNVLLNRTASTDSLSIGVIKFQNVAFLTSERSDQDRPRSDGLFVAGSISMNLFENFDLEIDLANNKVNIFAPNTCKEAAVYWAPEYATIPLRRTSIGQPYFLLELDGKKLQATFLPSNKNSIIYTDITKQLYGWDADSPLVQTNVSSDGTETWKYKAMVITANGLAITNANVALHKPSQCQAQAGITSDRDNAARYGDACFNVMPFYLGMDLLKKLHIYFSSKESVLYVTSANAHL